MPFVAPSRCFANLARTLSSALQTDFERIAQAVADEVEGQDGENDEDAGGVDHPPVTVEEVLSPICEHPAPGCRRRGEAEAEELERGENQNGVGDLEGGVDDDRADRVRDDVAQHRPPGAASHHPCGLDVFPSAARGSRPFTRRAGPSHDNKASTSIKRRRVGWITDARNMNKKTTGTASTTSTIRIMTASTLSDKAGDGAPEHAHARRDEGDCEADLDRALTPGHEPAQDVVTVVVGSEG